MKKAFILTDPKRRGHAWGNTEFGQEAAEREKPYQEPLLWFLVEGTGKAGSTGLGGQFESFQWALGHKCCPWLSGIWPWSDLTGDRETLVKEVAGV